MKVIGLTGSIGSGKSTVSCFFEELGAVVIDADQVSRQVVEPGSPALKELTVAFGENILNPDGSLNRTLVAEIVFNSDEKRELLNSIIHPMIFNEINSTIEEYREKRFNKINRQINSCLNRRRNTEKKVGRKGRSFQGADRCPY